jgi:Inositol-pentakisphosphate 2-kinase
MVVMEEEPHVSPPAWIYVGEGGQHAVFADRQSGRLWRVDKAIFRGSSSVSSSASWHALLHPYVDLPEHVFLDPTAIDALRETAWASGQIPPRRRRDWVGSDDGTGGWGCSMPDYRGPGVGVEIKPKGGYVTRSPLVEETRRHKYHKSRYVLLQELYREGTVVKDWMREDITDASIPASAYDPVDLFSKNAARMRQALHHLIECPQNNIQIWLDRRKVLGDNDADWPAVGAALGIPTSERSEEEVISLLMELLVQVLLQEPFLSRVLTLQKLDLLDTDGAILVFRRLVRLCDGDEETAEALLNDFPDEWTKGSDPITIPLLEKCPLPIPKESDALASLCDQLAEAAQGFETDTTESPQNVQKVRQTVDSLSLDECRYLLQAWLISLTMCDITFFLHLQRHVTSNIVPEYDDIRVLSLQQPNVPGRISFSPGKTELEYMLKTIDVDRKPASKVRSRYSKEQQFDRPGG